MTDESLADGIGDFYTRHAADFDAARTRSLTERGHLDAAIRLASRRAEPPLRVLDLGCGMGEPIARHFIDGGHRVTGVDVAAPMVARCRERFPQAEWIEADMRTLSLGRRFDVIVAWDSYFHLKMEDERAMFPVFARHAHPGGALLFTSGSEEGVAIGENFGDPLFHASLSTGETRRLLQANGYVLVDLVVEDPECGGHTVYLACRSEVALDAG